MQTGRRPPGVDGGGEKDEKISIKRKEEIIPMQVANLLSYGDSLNGS